MDLEYLCEQWEMYAKEAECKMYDEPKNASYWYGCMETYLEIIAIIKEN